MATKRVAKTEYEQERAIQKLHAKFQVTLFAAKSVFFCALSVAALVLAYKL